MSVPPVACWLFVNGLAPIRRTHACQVRHVGGLFRLRPNPDLAFDSTALPYAELSATVSDIVVQPASVITEHYSAPGAAEAAAREAARKAARGWGPRDTGDEAGNGNMLPEADLVQFKVGCRSQ